MSMKKKLKDVTLEDLAKLCHKQHDCYSCPFEKYCQKPPQYLFVKGQEEEEINL